MNRSIQISRKKNVQFIRGVINALARVEEADGDTKEIVYDRELQKIRSMDRENVLDIVREAVGDDPKRLKFAPLMYSELSDVPGIEAVFAATLNSADAVGRAAIIQTVGLKRISSLVGVLNEHFTREVDEFCRDQLLHTLGHIADESSLPIFEYLMRNNHRQDQWRILCAAHNYGRPEFRAYLQQVYSSPETKTSHRVMAAWGLAKLGKSDAYEFLVKMLDDPDRTFREGNTTVYEPGDALRAGQALADLNGWEFTWGKSSIREIKERLLLDSNR